GGRAGGAARVRGGWGGGGVRDAGRGAGAGCQGLILPPPLAGGREFPAGHAVSRCEVGWVPASLRCAGTSPGLTCAPQAVTASPAALATFTAALMSRSSHARHGRHCQARTCSGLGPSLAPQAEHT